MSTGPQYSSVAFPRYSPVPKQPPVSGHTYHPMNCVGREVCYGCSNCEPEYWKKHFPQVYENFFLPPAGFYDGQNQMSFQVETKL